MSDRSVLRLVLLVGGVRGWGVGCWGPPPVRGMPILNSERD